MSTGTLILNVDDTEGARYAKTRSLRHAGFEVLVDSRCPAGVIKTVDCVIQVHFKLLPAPQHGGSTPVQKT